MKSLMIRLLPIVLLLWNGALISATASVSLSFSNSPQALRFNQLFELSVVFEKPALTAENRLVFIVEVRRLADDALLVKQVQDNAGHGFLSQSGSLNFSMPGPEMDWDTVYFIAYAVPWSLNRAVIEHYESYPTDGTFQYAWVSGSYGVTQDIYYQGELIAPTNDEHTTYCSGITFETFVLSYLSYNDAYGHPDIGGMTAGDMRDFRRIWYGVTDAERLSGKAISDYGLGEEIIDFEEVQQGDFVQFWRHSGSGHSVVFVDWVRDATQSIIGFEYWSTQGSTDGIGYHTEYFGETSGVNRDRFWPARLRKSRDEGDTDWALGRTDTQTSPTSILEQGGFWQAH